MKTLTYTPFGTDILSEVIFCQTVHDVILPASLKRYRRALFVYDTALPQAKIKEVFNLFKKSVPEIQLHPFRYGTKSIQNLKNIWKHMVTTVPDLTIGMGGGTTSDLVGFASKTYQRGIPFVLVPTTVLGMVDASLGGKNAIDFGGVKNSIGSMHYPLIVVNIMEILATLPQAEFLSGLAESVKAAVLFDAHFFRELEEYVAKRNFSYRNPQFMSIVYRSASLKMKNSEMPSSHKVKLLYGHAIGQGYELMGKNRIRHGDAVAVGMTIEGSLACLLGLWSKKELQAQTKLLKTMHLPLIPSTYRGKFIETLLERMSHYKKLVTSDTYAFVFPVAIGKIADGDGTFLTHIRRRNMKSLLLQVFRVAEEFVRV